MYAGDLGNSLMKEKKIGLYMFFFSFLYSTIPYLDLRILKILIRVCFSDKLQPGGTSYVQEYCKLNEVNHG